MAKRRLVLGFSLIELLVVIAIIIILAGIGVANLRSASRKARDTRRLSDQEQLRGALELYRADAVRYPTSLYPSASNCSGQLVFNSNIYLRALPCDPQTNSPYRYRAINNRFGYYLGTVLELPSGTTSPINCNTTGLGGGVNYCLSNP